MADSVREYIRALEEAARAAGSTIESAGSIDKDDLPSSDSSQSSDTDKGNSGNSGSGSSSSGTGGGKIGTFNNFHSICLYNSHSFFKRSIVNGATVDTNIFSAILYHSSEIIFLTRNKAHLLS